MVSAAREPTAEPGTHAVCVLLTAIDCGALGCDAPLFRRAPYLSKFDTGASHGSLGNAALTDFPWRETYRRLYMSAGAYHSAEACAEAVPVVKGLFQLVTMVLLYRRGRRRPKTNLGT